MLFLINNFTSEKIASTGNEIKTLIGDSHHMWFAFHLVRDRAANEVQFHSAYVQMLLHIGNKTLLRTVVDVVCEGIMFMSVVCSEGQNLKENSNMRNMLKALGEFLGRLTLGRSLPLLRRDLDLRKLLMDAYQYGRLVAVMPVVTNIMQQSYESPVYRSLSNPWVKLVFGLLYEIYQLPNLKMMLAFSFETLCKTYDIKTDAVQPTGLLSSLSRLVEAAADFKPAATRDAMADTQQTAMQSSAMPQKAHTVAVPLPDTIDGGRGSIPGGAPVPPPPPPSAGLHQHIKIPQELVPHAEQLHLVAITATCMDRAISDVMASAVERSVNISCKATASIVLKDFVQDPSEARLRAAMRKMVAALTGSLAAVTCREPLQTGLLQQLQHALKSVFGPNLLDDVSAAIARANHAIGCEYVERIAVEKALKDIEEHLKNVRHVLHFVCLVNIPLSPVPLLCIGRTCANVLYVCHVQVQSFEVRRLHQPGQQFIDVNAHTHQLQGVPAVLQLQPGAPTPQQAAVYDTFQAATRRNVSPASLDQRFRNWLEEMDLLIDANPTLAYHTMKDNPTQKAIMEDISALSEQVNDLGQIEKMAAALFKCAAVQATAVYMAWLLARISCSRVCHFIHVKQACMVTPSFTVSMVCAGICGAHSLPATA